MTNEMNKATQEQQTAVANIRGGRGMSTVKKAISFRELKDELATIAVRAFDTPRDMLAEELMELVHRIDTEAIMREEDARLIAADARLIAGAPQLLAALDSLRGLLQELKKELVELYTELSSITYEMDAHNQQSYYIEKIESISDRIRNAYWAGVEPEAREDEG